MPAEIAGYCGRCGAPFTAESGAFCGSCGNAIVAAPPVATGYTYPVVAAASVPGAQHKLSHRGMLLVAGGTIAALVVVITVVVVLVHPGTKACGFFCGPPRSGARLAGSAAYKSQQFGYTVEYDKTVFNVAGQDAASVQLAANAGSGLCSTGTFGEIDFTATQGTDVNAAIQNAQTNLQQTGLQLQGNGAVNGAEIGFVPGTGLALTGTYQPPNNSGQGVPASAVIIAASNNGVTITVTAWSEQATDVAVAPYDLCNADSFDFPVSNTIWPGQ